MTAAPKQPPRLSFAISPAASPFGCRLGSLSLFRPHVELKVNTPGLLVTSSRGVIPHLSCDHVNSTKAIRWVNVPFESFLEQNPPLPTIYPGSNPLHHFLRYSLDRHILSMSARDPSDCREMPANGKDHLSVNCIRGVRKLSPSLWRSYARASNPDFILALSDTPFTKHPQSQKRLTKSIERSSAWLADMLLPYPSVDSAPSSDRLNVLVHMVGGTSISARQTFSESLLENLNDKDAELLKPLKNLDDGVVGYVFDLVALRQPHSQGFIPGDFISKLIMTSLLPLPSNKLRIANSTESPHEVLRLIQQVGVDVFDSDWVQEAANVGIALDFKFPLSPEENAHSTSTRPRVRDNNKHDLGHNIFDQHYAHDFTPLAQTFVHSTENPGDEDSCPCLACSPQTPRHQIQHSIVDEHNTDKDLAATVQPSYTRAYLHHLLHTHEMSAHAFLVMHNIYILDAFFTGIRTVLAEQGLATFEAEIDRFCAYYDEKLTLMEEAMDDWRAVDIARGKGRMAREKRDRDIDKNMP